jgi:hypothetical protein
LLFSSVFFAVGETPNFIWKSSLWLINPLKASIQSGMATSTRYQNSL